MALSTEQIAAITATAQGFFDRTAMPPDTIAIHPDDCAAYAVPYAGVDVTIEGWGPANMWLWCHASVTPGEFIVSQGAVPPYTDTGSLVVE